MAVDKKSDHVGNHDGRYTDMEGQTRQFTYIDHDKKPTIGGMVTETKEELEEALKQDRLNSINKILAMPASLCDEVHAHFTIRGEENETVKWNETMLKDPGVTWVTLYNIGTIVGKRFEATKKQY